MDQRTKVRTELKMAAQAARNRWDTPADKRREYVALARRMAADPESAPSYQESARKSLAAMQAAGWCD